MSRISLDSNKGTHASSNLTPAAEYVRMSTEHQQYSIDNQAAKIREYARARGLEIVETFADEGRSGLSINGRDSLRRLIDTVESGNAPFAAILVYDVSRWGRFQDADESAYYEYICRRAGIAVHYCAEQFENDGSPVATIVKGVKRAMAGEYSRELSAKVFAGQCRLIENGYRQGGPAGYGLRRFRIDEQGNELGVLEKGQHKSLQTDPVVLRPGPPEEISVVKTIFDLFVRQGLNELGIADRLNRDGVRGENDRHWTRGIVRQILTNEKYIGNNVYNRTSFKLKGRRVDNPPEMWVRCDNAFPAIVEPTVFFAAQGIFVERSRKLSDTEIINALHALYKQKGILSALIIDESADLPSSSAISHRFGGLVRAYRLVGFNPDRDYAYLEINRRLRQMHPAIVQETLDQLTRYGGHVTLKLENGLLTINDELLVSIVLARCQQTSAASYRWNLRLEMSKRPDITVAVRLDHLNKTILDYYVLPTCELQENRLRLKEKNEISIDAFRFDSLDYFYGIAERVQIRRVA